MTLPPDSPISEADGQAYADLLYELRARLDDGLAKLSGPPTLGVVETAAVHLRKSVEIIVLGSFVTNRKEIERIAGALASKDVNAARKLARHVNPEYWPKAKEPSWNESGGVNARPADGALTEQEWGKAFGYASDLLHAPNPYRTDGLRLASAAVRIGDAAREVKRWLTRTQRLMAEHQVVLAGRDDVCLLCSLRAGPKGDLLLGFYDKTRSAGGP